MRCPCCNQEMTDKSYTKMEQFYHWEDEEFYYRKVSHSKFICDYCRITCEDDEWGIPDSLKPTEKQIKTILFINNRLHKCFSAITKSDAWKYINDNFELAKHTECIPQYYMTDEDCDMYGLDASMFY